MHIVIEDAILKFKEYDENELYVIIRQLIKLGVPQEAIGKTKKRVIHFNHNDLNRGINLNILKRECNVQLEFYSDSSFEKKLTFSTDSINYLENSILVKNWNNKELLISYRSNWSDEFYSAKEVNFYSEGIEVVIKKLDFSHESDKMKLVLKQRIDSNYLIYEDNYIAFNSVLKSSDGNTCFFYADLKTILKKDNKISSKFGVYDFFIEDKGIVKKLNVENLNYLNDTIQGIKPHVNNKGQLSMSFENMSENLISIINKSLFVNEDMLNEELEYIQIDKKTLSGTIIDSKHYEKTNVINLTIEEVISSKFIYSVYIVTNNRTHMLTNNLTETIKLILNSCKEVILTDDINEKSTFEQMDKIDQVFKRDILFINYEKDLKLCVSKIMDNFGNITFFEKSKSEQMSLILEKWISDTKPVIKKLNDLNKTVILEEAISQKGEINVMENKLRQQMMNYLLTYINNYIFLPKH